MSEMEMPEIKIPEIKTSDFQDIGQIARDINNFVNNIPDDIKRIGTIAVGAAIGTRYPNVTLFLGLIYIFGRLMGGNYGTNQPSYRV